ncbi:hypothetical protein IL306_012542, partial [Fusarium sp. DS 682]
MGWLMADKRISPWAIKVGDIRIEIQDGVESPPQGPPSAREAACYLSRFCDAYDLGSQSSAALAAALTIPLHANAAPFDPAEIELPIPTLATHAM